MTSQLLQRQIDRIKTELQDMQPPPPPSVKVLLEPATDSMAAFMLDVQEARKTHDLVLVACHHWNDARVGQTIDGARYFESHFAALCHKASLTFTGDIRAFALSCCGNIFMPGSSVPLHYSPELDA